MSITLIHVQWRKTIQLNIIVIINFAGFFIIFIFLRYIPRYCIGKIFDIEWIWFTFSIWIYSTIKNKHCLVPHYLCFITCYQLYYLVWDLEFREIWKVIAKILCTVYFWNLMFYWNICFFSHNHSLVYFLINGSIQSLSFVIKQ